MNKIHNTFLAHASCSITERRIKMKKNIIVITVTSLSLLILAGCSNKYPVTIASSPVGADVSCNGRSYGYAPVTRYFELDKATKQSGYLRTCEWKLRWVSGATAIVNNVYDLNKFPNGVTWTTPRPNVEGYEKDAQFALQVQQMQYQRRQAKAAESTDASVQTQNYKLQNINNYIRYGY